MLQSLIMLCSLSLALFLYPINAKGVEKSFSNSIGMAFVEIPAGSFMMGSPENETGRDASEILHKVIITQPFYIQRTEVTLTQWRAVMGKRWLFPRKGDPDSPVTRVSWYDCISFIDKLNKMEKKGLYLLPTEAQWEYVCRAGSQSAYCWGNQIDCSKAMFGNNDYKSPECMAYLHKRHLSQNCPAPVESYAPNAWGVYDMSGNVWEWCQDWYAKYPKRMQADPKGPRSGNMKVRRGGSWFRDANALRCANRAYAHPASRLKTTGLRLIWIENPMPSDTQYLDSWQRRQEIYKGH